MSRQWKKKKKLSLGYFIFFEEQNDLSQKWAVIAEIDPAARGCQSLYNSPPAGRVSETGASARSEQRLLHFLLTFRTFRKFRLTLFSCCSHWCQNGLILISVFSAKYCFLLKCLNYFVKKSVTCLSHGLESFSCWAVKILFQNCSIVYKLFRNFDRRCVYINTHTVY